VPVRKTAFLMPRGVDWNGLTLLELRPGSKPALPESCTFLANYFTPSDRPPLIQAVFETDPPGVRRNGTSSPRTNSANVDRLKMKLEVLWLARPSCPGSVHFVKGRAAGSLILS